MGQSIRDKWGVETDSESWPLGLPPEERKDIVNEVRSFLAGAGRPCEMYIVHDVVRNRLDAKGTAPFFRKAAFKDWTYAVIDRAGNQLDCNGWWVLPSKFEPWTNKQLKTWVRAVRKSFGLGWFKLGDDLVGDILAAKVFEVAMREDMTIRDARELLRRVLKEAGLETTE